MYQQECCPVKPAWLASHGLQYFAQRLQEKLLQQQCSSTPPQAPPCTYRKVCAVLLCSEPQSAGRRVLGTTTLVRYSALHSSPGSASPLLQTPAHLQLCCSAAHALLCSAQQTCSAYVPRHMPFLLPFAGVSRGCQCCKDTNGLHLCCSVGYETHRFSRVKSGTPKPKGMGCGMSLGTCRWSPSSSTGAWSA
jgi:hypothetical protein